MLTKEDLEAIQHIIKKEIQDNLSAKLNPISINITSLKREVRRLRKDRDITETKHRVDRIEARLPLL